MTKEHGPSFHISENPCVPYKMLTPRRQEVLQGLAKGFSYLQIAESMDGISARTVEAFVYQIGKMGVDLASENDYIHQSRLTIVALIKDGIAQGYIKHDLPSASIQLLTPREYEVLNKTRDGKTSAEIYDELYLSEKTLESHKRNIRAKLHIKTNLGSKNGDYLMVARAEHMELAGIPIMKVK